MLPFSAQPACLFNGPLVIMNNPSSVSPHWPRAHQKALSGHGQAWPLEEDGLHVRVIMEKSAWHLACLIHVPCPFLCGSLYDSEPTGLMPPSV